MAQPILAWEVGTWVVPTQIAHAESEKNGFDHLEITVVRWFTSFFLFWTLAPP